ncbi:MAG: hypothetical protein LC130_36055 [Bryobacterales bacterium]|nr:hypothetical protein [Bryobacterales bacterium]
MSKHWSQTFYTYIWVFNTGRGLSVCVRFPHNVGMVYDLGASEDFSPADFIAKNIAPRLDKYENHAIAQTFLSHPHTDHILEIEAIQQGKPLSPKLITCPNDKVYEEAIDFRRLANGNNEQLLAAYRRTYEKRQPPLQTIKAPEVGSPYRANVPDVEYGLYYLRPPLVHALHPSNDHHYGNGISLVVYIRHGRSTVLLTGDITPDVFREVLKGRAGVEKRFTYFRANGVPEDFHTRTSTQPVLEKLLGERGLGTLVTPHHGLESCYCPDLFNAIRGNKTYINVISEKRHCPTDGTVDCRYQSEETSFGCTVNIDGHEDRCRSASTRNGHHILLILEAGRPQPYVFLRSDAYDLLTIA